MKYFWILTLFFFGTEMAAQAQQIAVRSGDHPTFSRITIAIPETQVWEVQQSERELIIAFPELIGTFNLQDVFSRMQRDRITNIAVANGSISLRTNCSCEVNVFRSGSLLVIDVADPDKKAIASDLEASTALRNIRPPLVDRRAPLQQPILPWIGAHRPLVGKTVAEAIFQDNAAITTGHARLLSDAQQTLVEEVANAASSGLLESNNPAPSQRKVKKGEDRKAETTRHEAPTLPVADSSQNLRISSSMNPKNQSRNPDLDATTGGAACPDGTLFAVHDWGDETDFSAQIGPARNALVDARDRLDQKAIKNLAQAYIYFGFGAEALEVLRLSSDLHSANMHLAQIATILERGSIEGPNSIGIFTDCASDIALWASLSYRTLPVSIQIDTNASLRALNKLPMHLRQILAPALSERLLEYGDPQSAATALRSIERQSNDLAPNALMAQADLTTESSELLEKVITANTEESPAALIKLVKGKLAVDQSLPPQTATLVEAYAHELRGTEIGNQLLQTHILALTQSVQFGAAFEALEELSPSLSLEVSVQLRQAVFEKLAKSAPDVAFLEHMFAQPKEVIGTLPDKTKLLLASRLMDLGFAKQVQEALTEIPEAPKQDTRQILAARAAIALMQPFQAQAALIGIEGKEAEVLLAEAKEMTGSFVEAAELFQNNNSELRAIQASWLSDQWSDPAGPAASALSAVAALTEPAPFTPDLGPIGRANLALEESNKARVALQAILADPTVQVSPNF